MLFDLAKAQHEFTAGVYLTDGETLWRILDLPEQARKGFLPLEDCRFPNAPPLWREVRWLTDRKARVVRP